MSLVVYIITTLIILVLIVGLYQKSTNAICTSRKRLDGKTVIVTGGTTGIGLETAMDFAERGARVIIACPFQSEGDNALKLITEKTENKHVVFKLLDLSSLASIRKFTADIIDTEKRLDVLINNAGIGFANKPVTEDGMGFMMQVNYFGPFLLTLLLLPLLNKTGTISEPARIVNVSSVLHNFGFINLDKINVTKYWLPMFGFWYQVQIYSNSKLCSMLFAHKLSKKLRGNIVVNCVDPGYVGTRIFGDWGRILGPVMIALALLFFKTPWYGAQTTIYATLDREAGKVSGQMFKNCQLSRAKRSAYDDETAQKLWNKSISLVGLSSEELEQCFQ
ncbi:dehydrogenase/reductase SDR family member 13-like [Melitaea cinxia]|uniref:dehydrogenase/reductase SDR family member 13-like n=1 Tax=Melitaea cinxia TaxID=113334 RepID=UPI001E26E972|nr:dehydrogenase/reductase SDR family member 13-like [Melitaea cinxia]